MILRISPFLCFYLWLLPTIAHAQKLEKITSLKLYYWRAFHGEIAQELSMARTGEITLVTTVTPPRDDTGSTPTSKRTEKIIKGEDLAPVLAFFNDVDARQAFTMTERKIQTDGAILSITIKQNSFSMSVESQDAFQSDAGRYPAALGRVAVALFGLAEITIPKDDLY